MKITEEQKKIVEGHKSEPGDMIQKDYGVIIGSSMGGPAVYHSSAELAGLCNREIDYLPHFEFNVVTTFQLNLNNDTYSGSVHHTDGGLAFSVVQGDRHIPIQIPKISDFFILRRLAQEGNLQTFPAESGVLPPAAEVSGSFFLRASSTTYGQLIASMPIDHPEAESVIGSFLRTIDERFADYASLEQHYRRENDNGKRLWEDQGMQSRAYNKERKRLHKALFGGLEKVLKAKGIDRKIV